MKTRNLLGFNRKVAHMQVAEIRTEFWCILRLKVSLPRILLTSETISVISVQLVQKLVYDPSYVHLSQSGSLKHFKVIRLKLINVEGAER